MASRDAHVPASRGTIVQMQFLEHRAKVLDLAAFLDRVERAQPAPGEPADDFRMRALREAIDLLCDGKPERARRVLELWSDRSAEPIAAAPMKGAMGAAERSDAGGSGTGGAGSPLPGTAKGRS
jgi:hypothetical protein